MKKIMRLSIMALLALCLTSAFAQNAAPNNKLYDFKFVDMTYAAAFHSISATAGVDIILAPDVSGKIDNLQVTKKNWQDVLKLICDTYDLTWTIQDKYIYVQRSASYQEKQKKIAEQIATEELSSPLVRKNFQVQHAKASELVTVLESMKSTRGKITTVDRSNSIIVYDTQKSIDQMANALEELDVETLQIMITAKLVVVSSSLARQLGVDWTAKMGTQTLTPGTVTTPTGGGTGSRTSAAISALGSGSSPSVSGATTAITASVLDNNVQVAVANLLSDASTEVLATPQISTMDNVEAKIFMGDQISIRVIDDDGESSTKLVETGIKLTVTPHVSGDNRIMLDLHPENNSYGYDNMGEVVISTQDADTKVVVGDGETVVIGGLTKNENTETESGIPFLMDIPVLGNLFKYSSKSVKKKDLVIFVTPRIIHNYIGNVPNSEPPRTKFISGVVDTSKVQRAPASKADAPASVDQVPIQQPAPPASADSSSGEENNAEEGWEE